MTEHNNAERGQTRSIGYLAMTCLGALPGAAHGQAADEAKATELKGVTVTDTAIDPDSFKVDAPASPKFTAPLVDTPRSVVVIPQAVLKATASTTLVEALRTVPGITLGAGEGGNPLGDRPFIRGFDAQNSTYLDGVRDVGAQSREIFDIDQIEVVKGSDSVMGGYGSAGGTLNLVSKLPQNEDFTRIAGSIGNAQYKRATVDVNRTFNDFVGVRLNAMWHDQNVAGRDAIWQKRWGIAPSVKLGVSGPTSLTLSYYHMESKELPDSGIPYLYTVANAPAGVTQTEPAQNFTTIAGRQVSVPRGAFYGLKDRDFRNAKVDDFTMRAEHEFAGGVTLRNTARWGRSEQDYIVTQPDDSQGDVYGTNASTAATAGGYVWRRANTRYAATEGMIDQTDLFGKATLLGMEHSFTASLELSHERAYRGTFVSNAATGTVISSGSTISPRCPTTSIARYYCTTIDAPNPDDPWTSTTSDTSTATTPIVKSAPITQTITTADTKGASLFDTITIVPSLLVNFGGRFDHYDTTVSPGLAATATTGRSYLNRVDNLFTYQAGVVFKPTADTSLYASTATAATPPGSYIGEGSDPDGLVTTSQAATDALKVEKTRSYEVGAKADLFDRRLSLTLALFDTDTRNARSLDDANTVAFIGERKIKGVEFGFNGNITPAWSVYGGYTYMHSRIENAGSTTTTLTDTVTKATLVYVRPSPNTGRPFPNTPKHSLTAFTNYKITDAFTLGGGAIYMSKVYGGYADIPILTNGVVTNRQFARAVPAYWRFDASAALKLTPFAALQFNVNNVLNKRYYDKAYATHYANQAAGRTGILTLNVEF